MKEPACRGANRQADRSRDTLRALSGGIPASVSVSGPQVTFGVFDLKPGLLLDGRSQRVCMSAQQKTHAHVLFLRNARGWRPASVVVQQQQQQQVEEK